MTEPTGVTDRPAVLPAGPVRRLAGAGTVATGLVAVGGSLAGGAARSGGWWWAAPAVPVRPLIGVVPALVLFYGGLILACRCWSRLRQEVTAGTIGGAGVIVVFCLWATPLVLAPPLGSRDVYAYAAAGQVAAEGLDPYEVGPIALGTEEAIVGVVDPRWRDAPTPYGPLFVSVAEGVAGLTTGVLTSVLLLRVLALGGLLLAAWGLMRLAGPDAAPLALVLLLCNPLVLLHLVSGAHNEALMIGLLVAGLAVGSRCPMAGVVVCALAGAIKAPALLGVVHLGWAGAPAGASWRHRLVTLAGAGLLALATLAAAGQVSGLGWGWVGTVDGARDVVAYLSPTTVAGTVLGHLVGADGLPGLAQGVGVAAAAACTAVLMVRSHRSGLAGLGTALVVVALLGPVVQPWYLAWGGAVIVAAASPERVRLLVVGSVGLCFAVLPAGPDLGRLVVEQPLAAVGALAVLTALALAGGPRSRWAHL